MADREMMPTDSKKKGGKVKSMTDRSPAECEKKVRSLLGLAMRGRNLVSGETQVLEAIRGGTALLVLVAKDASANSGKMFRDKCAYYEVPIREFGKKEELGAAIGKDYRSAVAICESGLARSISEWIDRVQGEK